MPLRTSRASALAPASYQRQLAWRVLSDASDAAQAAMALLEHCEPQTIGAAVALLVEQGTITVRAFDLVADSWESYRHLRHLSWD